MQDLTRAIVLLLFWLGQAGVLLCLIMAASAFAMSGPRTFKMPCQWRAAARECRFFLAKNQTISSARGMRKSVGIRVMEAPSSQELERSIFGNWWECFGCLLNVETYFSTGWHREGHEVWVSVHRLLAGTLSNAWRIVEDRVAGFFDRDQTVRPRHSNERITCIFIADVFDPNSHRTGIGRSLFSVACQSAKELWRAGEHDMGPMRRAQFFLRVLVCHYGCDYCSGDQSNSYKNLYLPSPPAWLVPLFLTIGGVSLLLFGQVVFLCYPSSTRIFWLLAFDFIGGLAFALGLDALCK